MTERPGPSFEDISGGKIPFSPDLQRILSYAAEEADRMRHNYIGSEHFVLGLLRDPNASRGLNGIGLTLQRARAAVEFIIGRGEAPSVHITDEAYLSPRAKIILETATEKAKQKEMHEVGLGEFGSALFSSDGISMGVLESLRISPSDAIRELTRPEVCRHDRELFWELAQRLRSASYASREVTATTRLRDIDRSTERWLRAFITGTGFGNFQFKEDDLADERGFVTCGPLGLVYRMVFNKGLTSRERNRLMLHFAGVIATGNLGDNGLHRELSSVDEPQRDIDAKADEWARKLRDDLLASDRAKSIFAQGIARALGPKEEDPGYRTRRMIAGALEAGSNINP